MPLSRNILRLSETKFLVQSSTIPRRAYTVEKSGGVWICNCKGFNLCCITKNTNCRHIDALFEARPDLANRLPEGSIQAYSPFGQPIEV